MDIGPKVQNSHSWDSETGNTTKSNSIDMEKECLVQETSFDYGKNSTIVGEDSNQTPTNSKVKTKKTLSKPLGKIDFSSSGDNDEVFSDAFLELSPLLKKMVLIVLEVISTPSKFAGIIRVTFTPKSSLAQASKKTADVKILMNTNLKKSAVHSDLAVVLKKIPIGTFAEAVYAALSDFGIIKSIKMQLIGLWQKAVVEFEQIDYADLTNAHDIWNYINSVGGRTCIIDCHLVSYAQAKYTAVCFDSAKSLDAVMRTMPMLKNVNMCWFCLVMAKCAKCENSDHISLNYTVDEKISSNSSQCRILSNTDKNRLATIYAKCLALVVQPVAFGEVKPTLLVSLKWNNRFAILKCSLASLAECVDKLAKKLNTSRPMNQGTDIVISESLSVITSGGIFVEIAVFDSSVVSKMKKTLNNLSITVIGFLAKMDNAGLVPAKIATCNVQGVNISTKQEDIICWHNNLENMIKNKFDGVKIFFSELDKGFLGTGVAIIMNNFLACHVFKVEEVFSQVISVKLFFKDKFLVSILGFYTGASTGARFSQALEINSFISKAVNSSTFVVLSGDFNKNSSKKSASFKFCSDLGLINLFAVAGQKISSVSDYFDTDHKAVEVSVSLDRFLDVRLNGLCKQANKDSRFKECTFIRFSSVVDEFLATSISENFDSMWSLLVKVMVDSADETFFRHWFCKVKCSFNKHSSKFFKLEMLVAKVVKSFQSGNAFRTGFFLDAWLIADEKKALKIHESRAAEAAAIRSAIDKKMENFCSDKGHMIKSILNKSFHKVVLDYLVVDNELVLDSVEIKSKICQYALLQHVDNSAFSGVMNVIGFDKLFQVVKHLSNRKTAGLSGLPNELW
ncbi:hypothetical protein G9A89_004308 [Geosiphon pyriformis]|nr:hypothetical protein G9A89_004308 [Geosiphon pyriformis]